MGQQHRSSRHHAVSAPCQQAGLLDWIKLSDTPHSLSTPGPRDWWPRTRSGLRAPWDTLCLATTWPCAWRKGFFSAYVVAESCCVDRIPGRAAELKISCEVMQKRKEDRRPCRRGPVCNGIRKRQQPCARSGTGPMIRQGGQPGGREDWYLPSPDLVPAAPKAALGAVEGGEGGISHWQTRSPDR